MTEISKKAIYKHFNGTSYERINFKTTASQVDEEENLQFVSKADKTNWNGKASKDVASITTPGLMSASDKAKLEGIQAGANKYDPPKSYSAKIITTDQDHLFVTKTEKDNWNAKATKDVATQNSAGLMSVIDKKKLDGLINIIYPVGSIYMSVVDKDPKDFIGGTWRRWGKGSVPLGVDTSDKDFNKAGLVGGEKTHTLKIEETPFCYAVNEAKGYGLIGSKFFTDRGVVFNGNTTPQNNLPPYVTCYMWERTA